MQNPRLPPIGARDSEGSNSVQLGFVADLGADRNHKYGKYAAAEQAQPRPRLVRLGKEVASLNVDLPLNPSSSVFARVDEQNMTLWQALITGAHAYPATPSLV